MVINKNGRPIAGPWLNYHLSSVRKEMGIDMETMKKNPDFVEAPAAVTGPWSGQRPQWKSSNLDVPDMLASYTYQCYIHLYIVIYLWKYIHMYLFRYIWISWDMFFLYTYLQCAHSYTNTEALYRPGCWWPSGQVGGPPCVFQEAFVASRCSWYSTVQHATNQRE